TAARARSAKQGRGRLALAWRFGLAPVLPSTSASTNAPGRSSIALMKNIDTLTGIAEGLRELARAVAAAPGALKAAYLAGFLDGALVAAMLLVIAYLITRRNS